MHITHNYTVGTEFFQSVLNACINCGFANELETRLSVLVRI